MPSTNKQTAPARVLAIGHSYVVDSNRAFWSRFAELSGAQVDMLVPEEWNSNLIRSLSYKANPTTDAGLGTVIPLKCYFPGKGSYFFFHPWRLWKALRQGRYDAVILAEETWSLSLAQLALTLLFVRPRPRKLILVICQNIKKSKLAWLHPWEQIICAPVTGIGHCCQEIVDVLHWKGIHKRDIYFPFSYDERLYKSLPLPTEGPLVLGYIGRLTSEKGLPTLITALKELREEHAYSGLRLRIAGDGPLREELAGLDFVDMLGPMPHNQAHTFYRGLHAIVLPSETTDFWKEQFGRVIIEAVASGVGVIGSSSGAIPEVMHKLALPWVFAEKNSDTLKRMLMQYNSDLRSGKAQSILDRARELNRKQFSHQAVAHSLAKDLLDG